MAAHINAWLMLADTKVQHPCLRVAEQHEVPSQLQTPHIEATVVGALKFNFSL
jgi:hypothetical protein